MFDTGFKQLKECRFLIQCSRSELDEFINTNVPTEIVFRGALAIYDWIMNIHPKIDRSGQWPIWRGYDKSNKWNLIYP